MAGTGGGRGGNYGGYQGSTPRRDEWQRPVERPVAAETLPENYADAAEKVIKGLIHTNKYGKEVIDISTSKIRRLFSLVIPILNKERLSVGTELAPESRQALMMARVRTAYEAGRDNTVKTFVTSAKLMEYIKDIGGSKEKFLKFTHYMEALVAWHRYYGGKEN